jgi:hypothetical protein
VEGKEDERERLEMLLRQSLATFVQRISTGILNEKLIVYFLNIIMNHRNEVINSGNFVEALIELSLS